LDAANRETPYSIRDRKASEICKKAADFSGLVHKIIELSTLGIRNRWTYGLEFDRRLKDELGEDNTMALRTIIFLHNKYVDHLNK